MRRGHGSTKVPNVKLRPPPPKEKAKTRVVQDDDSMDVDAGPSDPAVYRDYSEGAKPFANVILCSTGIKDKVTLFKQASELGAVCQHDLTSDITHLVATETGGAKYNCAIDNGMAVMTPEWVEETYKIWLKGDDIDLDESVRRYRLPFLSGFNICLTGGDIDADKRREISRVIAAHGGVYSSSLTKQCTHLLVGAASFEAVANTDKVKFAFRVNKENKAHMHVLWLEWLWDCVTVSGKLEEPNYRIDHEKPTPRAPPVAHELVPLRSGSSAPSAAARAQPRAPPPAVTVDVSKDAPEPGVAPSITQGQRSAQQIALWQQLQLANLPGSSQSESQKARKAKVVIELPPIEEAMDAAPAPVNGRSVPVIKLATPITDESKSVLSRLALSKASSFHYASETTSRLKAAPFNPSIAQAGPSMPASQRKQGLFEGKKFHLIGDARSNILEGALQSSGGIVLPEGSSSAEDSDEPDWVVVRLNTGAKHLPKGTLGHSLRKYVTECWIEECMHQERVCDPDDHVTFRPILVSTPVPGTGHMRLHISGLTESNSLYTQRLARTLGAQVAVVFSKKSATHLICPTGAGIKYEHALQWGIPAFKPEWLHEMARTGAVPAPAPYSHSLTMIPPPISDVTNHVPQGLGPPVPTTVLPSPPQENIQPPSLSIRTSALQARPSDRKGRSSSRTSSKPSSSSTHTRASTSPSKSSANTSASDALTHLAAALGDKRKSLEPDAEEKALPAAKRRTRPVTRIKSGDISTGSASSGKSTFAALQRLNLPGPLGSGEEEGEPSVEISFGAPLGESLRVTYDDPESRAEKKKLLKLIGVLEESLEPAAASETLDSAVGGSGTGRPPRPRSAKRTTRQS